MPGAKGGPHFNTWRLEAKTFTVEDNLVSDQLYDFGAATHMRIGEGNGRLQATLGRSSFAFAAGGSSVYWENTATISISYPFGHSDLL